MSDSFLSLAPAGLSPGQKENTANRSWLTRLARLALTPLATCDRVCSPHENTHSPKSSSKTPQTVSGVQLRFEFLRLLSLDAYPSGSRCFPVSLWRRSQPFSPPDTLLGSRPKVNEYPPIQRQGSGRYHVGIRSGDSK